MSIEVSNESGVAVDESAIASVARHVLTTMRVNPAAELSVMVVTLEVMTELHEWQDARSEAVARAAQRRHDSRLLGTVGLDDT